MKRIVCSLLVLLMPLCFFLIIGRGSAMAAESGAPVVSVEASVDRDFGYYIGDLVKVYYKIVLPPHYLLNRASLPKEQQSLNSQIDLKKIIIERKRDRGYQAYHSYFIYQVFASGDQADFIEIPEIHFSYGPHDNPSDRAAVLPPLRVVISPLAPQGASFKPAIPWIRSSLFPGIIWWGGAALLLINFLLLLDSIRKFRSSPSPFSVALKELSREQDATAALILFRRALNETAGKAIFANNLDEFFHVFPPGTSYRDEIRQLLLLSDRMSFDPEYHQEHHGSTERIRLLLKKLRRKQRWA